MLDSLKHAGMNIGRELGRELGRGLGRAWEGLSEGWRELLSRSSNALTHFSPNRRDEAQPESGALATFPRWSLLAGEVEETDKEIVVRVEVPGMEKNDCRITIEGNMLHLRGEKHFERETGGSTYHVMERAYGAFQRTIPLPRNVDTDRAEANYRNGVLSIRLPKAAADNSRNIRVS